MICIYRSVEHYQDYAVVRITDDVAVEVPTGVRLVRHSSSMFQKNIIIMPPFEEEGVYCFAHVRRSVDKPF